jgi:hypothetical protein
LKKVLKSGRKWGRMRVVVSVATDSFLLFLFNNNNKNKKQTIK